jgi:hypothetical protein
MEVQSDLHDIKLEAQQLLWSLQDPISLQKVLALLIESQPTPQHILDLIDQRCESAKHQTGTPIEDFLKEIEDL